MLNESHATQRQRDMPLRVLLARLRHEGCGGGAGRAELMSGVDGVSSWPVRRIVLRSSPRPSSPIAGSRRCEAGRANVKSKDAEPAPRRPWVPSPADLP
jgi:hypothetical protein